MPRKFIISILIFVAALNWLQERQIKLFLNMDRIQLTGNGSELNLLGKIREITSSELIFGGFSPFETTVPGAW